MRKPFLVSRAERITCIPNKIFVFIERVMRTACLIGNRRRNRTIRVQRNNGEYHEPYWPPWPVGPGTVPLPAVRCGYVPEVYGPWKKPRAKSTTSASQESSSETIVQCTTLPLTRLLALFFPESRIRSTYYMPS